MTAPKDRDALIEVMARALAGPGAYHWVNEPDDSDPEAFIAVQRDLDCQTVETILTALESSGCAVVPVEATEGMGLAGARSLRDTIRDTNQISRARAVRTAMLQSSPYRKE